MRYCGLGGGGLFWIGLVGLGCAAWAGWLVGCVVGSWAGCLVRRSVCRSVCSRPDQLVDSRFGEWGRACGIRVDSVTRRLRLGGLLRRGLRGPWSRGTGASGGEGRTGRQSDRPTDRPTQRLTANRPPAHKPANPDPTKHSEANHANVPTSPPTDQPE